ncbi:hypothetical protein [Wenjunlia vitaminophila]|uniref:hypothetical protein n=1 Tax=Wenjunlia vitaminophila TaxID=76728 RepID=UPI0003650C6B|nr:hypothetical protein [Wenjunlia vitaminophila]
MVHGDHAAQRRETLREIAARHGRSYDTVRNKWSRHPDFPAPVGKRGRSLEYDTQAVDRWVQAEKGRPAPDLEPARLYTAQDLEVAGVGITAGTIRADLARGRWPKPDHTTGGNRWRGATVIKHLAGRRAKTTPTKPQRKDTPVPPASPRSPFADRIGALMETLPDSVQLQAAKDLLLCPEAELEQRVVRWEQWTPGA